MSDLIPKAGTLKIGGLGRAAQKLQAAKEKAAQVKSGVKSHASGAGSIAKVKEMPGNKKTSFQRKAV